MLKRQPTKKTTSERIGAKSILIALVAFFVFFLLLSSVVDLFSKYRAIRAHIKELKSQQVALGQKKESVTAMNDYIDTAEGKEEVFRDKYRLVKPGEGMIVITNDPPEDPAPPARPGIARFWDTIMRGLGLR